MTVARAAGFGALLLVVVLAAYLLVFRGSGGHEYTLMFQNAGQLVKDDDVQIGGRRIGSVKEIELTTDNQAAIKITVEEPYAPLHEGTRAIDPRDVAVGRREPLHRARARAQQPPRRSPTARPSTRTDDRRRRPRPVFNTLDPKTRKSLSRRHPGLRDPVRLRQGRRPATKYFNPLLSTLAPARRRGRRRTRTR